MLQTRNGKRTAAAALKFSMDMYKEKLIDWETAVLRNPADQLDQLLAPIFDVAQVKKAKAIASGLPAGPGAASGKIYLNADRAAAAAEKGEKVLLVRNETSPEDLRGMIAAEGILTAKGALPRRARGAPNGQGLHLRRFRGAHRLRKKTATIPASVRQRRLPEIDGTTAPSSAAVGIRPARSSRAPSRRTRGAEDREIQGSTSSRSGARRPPARVRMNR
jgi:hypothetical protein